MIDDFKRPDAKPASEPLRLDKFRLIRSSKSSESSSSTRSVSLNDPKDPENLSEPIFKTPEEVANENAEVAASDRGIDSGTPSEKKPNSGRFALPFSKFDWATLTKRQKILCVVGVLLILILISGSVYALAVRKPAAQKPIVAVKTIPQTTTAIPKPIVSNLTGLPVTSDQQKLPVTGVMVENSPDARPQSGLKDAGVVFEAIAEGGITRFLALYQEEEPGNIGPIRSSRPYYLQWALGFDASYAHVGGSPDALADIKAWGVKDLDQFYNSSGYHRINTRYAPHNVYTSRADLLKLQNSKGYSTSTYTPLVRKVEAASKAPTTTSIDLAISGYYYNVHYDYDTTANSYKRTEGGAAHIDADSNTQLEPKVVVALVMPYSLMADGYHSVYNTIGSGKAYVFQDGLLTTGTWTKADMKSQFTFTDDTGKPLGLDPGQTWISAIGAPSNVTYK
jgi:hypothetical protein